MSLTDAAVAASFAIDPSNPNNGLFDIYSATLDPPLSPGGAPFFGGSPPATREITIFPTPSGLLAAADTTQCPRAFYPGEPRTLDHTALHDIWRKR